MPDSELFADRYEMEREIGAGGMARVFRAIDIKYERPVAIKILRPELASGIGRTRFAREIMIAARLSHPHILPLFDSGEFEDMVFFVMPYVEGPTLRVRLMQEGQFEFAQAIDITRNVASALDYAHRQGVVHRDIKPENIMTHDGVAMVADFGIGKALSQVGGENLTQAGVMIGTPAYMSPEQIGGDPNIDGRTDVYSLGCVLYEMLGGQKPFEASTPHESLAIRFTKPAPNIADIIPHLPSQIGEVIKRALATELSDRFASAGEFAAALTDATTSAPSRVRVPDDTKEEPSVAVLPFANMSSDPENEYFSDGITDEVINALMQLKYLHVAARTSSFAFKGKDMDIADVGAQLQVNTVLEGSVRRSGSRVRITAQLISVSDGYNIWSERYDREMDDVFAIQDEIASTIADRLRVALTAPPQTAAVKRPTDDIDAYQHYLRGRYLWNRRTEEGLFKSIEYFDKAIALDPTYALAHAGKADAYLLLGSYLLMPREESYVKAKAAALQALELDETLAEAHTSLGQALRWDLDWTGEERAYRRAIALNPRYPTAHQWFGGLLGLLGRNDEAIKELEIAIQLDPLSHAIGNTLAFVLLHARRYKEGLERVERTLELAPDFLSARALAVYFHALLGNRDVALQGLDDLIAMRPDHPYWPTHRAMVLITLGDLDEGRAFLEAAKKSDDGPGVIGFVHAALGDHDAAFHYFGQALEHKDFGFFVGLKGHPALDPIRSDARFTKLLKQLGLPAD